MNCEKMQRRVLLARSSKMSADAVKQIEEHLRSCGDCRAYRDDVENIVSTVKDALPSRTPSSSVLTRIYAEARQAKRPGIIAFPRPAIQILAYAATIVLAVGGWHLMTPSNETQVQGSRNDIGAIIACLEEETTYYERVSTDTGLSELAKQLLMMEGLSVDQLSETETAIQLEEPQTTSLQSDSSPVPPGKKYV